MPKTLSREEFYALVWSKPMTHLAREFGVSDVALHKHCRKHNVPTPPQGYWAKMAHGKPVKQTPLGKDTGPHVGEQVVIYVGAGATEAPTAAAARSKVLEALAATAVQPTPEVQDPVLVRSLRKLSQGKAGKDGIVRVEGKGMISIAVRSECVDRAGSLLEELVQTATKAAIRLSDTDAGVVWQVEGETVSFQLVEVPDRIEHVATQRELQAVAKWEAERQASYKRTGYLSEWGRPQIPKWEERLQGRLAIELEGVRDLSANDYWGPNIRGKFADAKNREVEKAIPRIVATIAVLAATKRENAVAAERRRREREEAEARRREAERRAALERGRLDLLETILGWHAGEVRLAAWLDDLSLALGTDAPSPRVAKLHKWAAARLERMRERSSPTGLEQLLSEKKVFDDEEL